MLSPGLLLVLAVQSGYFQASRKGCFQFCIWHLSNFRGGMGFTRFAVNSSFFLCLQLLGLRAVNSFPDGMALFVDLRFFRLLCHRVIQQCGFFVLVLMEQNCCWVSSEQYLFCSVFFLPLLEG
uniref:Secreted protein n=1 Tax=Nicotiana tabacum TaxID=4097 RepID=A0A1S4CU27_TOBAC|nr:PREDICTED: uncharacterized protein LOC107822587 [Nicotiana tabacum]